MNWLKKIFGRGSQRSTPSAAQIPHQKAATTPLPATPDEIRARFGHLERPAVQLRATTSSKFSRLGGLPNLPVEAEWPEWNGKPQSFLAQLDLAEIHKVLPSFLPASGYLYFFYDQQQSVWGFDPKDVGGWRVLYAVQPTQTERAAPVGLPSDCVYQSKPVLAECINLLPDSQSLPPSDFDWGHDGEAYSELRLTAFAGDHHHQVLGYPTPVQNDDMEEECQLASNGVYVGTPEGYKDSRVADLKAGATDWKLLLQLDTDDDTGWMWGDVGTLYFWIREQDAARADFSKVWMVFQCC